MRRFFLVALALLGACATHYPHVPLREGDYAGTPLAINHAVPFIEQTPQLCGPTALFMVSKAHRPDLRLEELTKMSFTPAAQGAFKQDMLAASRRLGLAPYRVASLGDVFATLAEGTPVLLFHRTKFLWRDYWHYSVLTGYDRPARTFRLHIGPYANHEADLSDLVGSWEEGGRWAYAVYPPSLVPPRASIEEAVDNALAFLRLGFVHAARETAQVLRTRWPDRYEGDVLMADVHLKLQERREAIESLRAALRKRPDDVLLKRKTSELARGWPRPSG